MLPRFFAPDARVDAKTGTADAVALPADESTHATRVLRLAVGNSIRVFNGKGGEWRAEITDIDRVHVRVTLLEAVTPAREARIPITLALAVLKGDKMDDVVRDAVMLGAAAIQPVVTERSEISLAALERSDRVERWRRIAVASCKQCGRAVVPPVSGPQPFATWSVQPATGVRVMLVEPGSVKKTRNVYELVAPRSAEVVVGPEGGWTDREVGVAESAGARLVTLGAITLRADAMPLVALTAIRTVWRDL